MSTRVRTHRRAKQELVWTFGTGGREFVCIEDVAELTLAVAELTGGSL
jgi:hypothetical protein